MPSRVDKSSLLVVPEHLARVPEHQQVGKSVLAAAVVVMMVVASAARLPQNPRLAIAESAKAAAATSSRSVVHPAKSSSSTRNGQHGPRLFRTPKTHSSENPPSCYCCCSSSRFFFVRSLATQLFANLKRQIRATNSLPRTKLHFPSAQTGFRCRTERFLPQLGWYFRRKMHFFQSLALRTLAEMLFWIFTKMADWRRTWTFCARLTVREEANRLESCHLGALWDVEDKK